jgi:hypothetical protein
MTTLVTRIVIRPESRVWIWRRTGSREPANAAEALARSWPSRTSDYPRGASCTENEPRPTREGVDQQRPQPRRATAQTAGRRGARTVPCPPELTALLREQFHGVRRNLAAASRPPAVERRCRAHARRTARVPAVPVLTLLVVAIGVVVVAVLPITGLARGAGYRSGGCGAIGRGCGGTAAPGGARADAAFLCAAGRARAAGCTRAAGRTCAGGGPGSAGGATTTYADATVLVSVRITAAVDVAVGVGVRVSACATRRCVAGGVVRVERLLCAWTVSVLAEAVRGPVVERAVAASNSACLRRCTVDDRR